MEITRKELNYLNIIEIKNITKKLVIPIHIHYKKNDGIVKKTSEIESKKYLLNKIYSYINGKREFKPLVYSNKIICINNFKKNYKESDLVLYGDFKSTNINLKNYLKKITNNKFYFGAIAFIIAHKLWRHQKTITLKEYSKIWINENNKHDCPLDEWAYMVYINNGFDKNKWKEYRKKKANKIIKLINKLQSK